MRRPVTLLLDLDDTIVSFSAGGRDFWREALEQELAHEAERFDAILGAIEAASDHYWSDPERAAQGRQRLIEARRHVARTAFTALGIPADTRTDAVADAFTWAKEEAVAPFETSLAALDALKAEGFQLGMVTNGCSEFQRRKLRRYDLERYFEAIAVEGEHGVGKPDPSIYRSVLKQLGAAPESTWMVGDNLRADIAGSQAVGIFAVWNDVYGTGVPRHRSERPDHTIRHLGELVSLLARVV